MAQINTQSPLLPRRKKSLLERMAKHWRLYLLLVVPLAYIVIFAYIPMAGVQIAFKEYNAIDGIWGSKFVGLDQFKKIFSTPKIFQLFRNTLSISLYSICFSSPLTLIFSLVLNAVRNAKYKKTVQLLTYMPHFISTVVMVGILMQILNPRVGMYGVVCDMLGIEAVDLFAIPEAFPHIYVWSGIWQNMGWGTIIYLAALSNVDMELYDAADIDGASRVKKLIHIDLPAVLPTFVILLIMSMGGILGGAYEKVLLLQNYLNLARSETIGTYSYKVALETGTDYSYGAAIGLFNSAVSFVLMIIVNKISKKVTEASLW